MAYDVTLVQVNANIGGYDTTGVSFGFPSGFFDTIVMSMWTCLPSSLLSGCNIGPSFLPFFGFGAHGGRADIDLINESGEFYTASFTSAPNSLRANHLVSVNCHTQTVQYYCNDLVQTQTSGPGWKFPAEFKLDTFNLNSWDFDVGSGFGANFPAIADFWMGTTREFVDLSIEANRRKFINADLTPVDLGSTGANPFGISPQIFQTIPPAGVPNTYLVNRGSGGGTFLLNSGAFLTFQTPGTCQLPVTVPLIGVSATAQVGTLSFPTSIWAITSNIQTASPGAVGDVWANNSYIDFSDPTVRSTFENADGSWLNLGYNGATPTGSSPLLYLTVQLQQPPSDILTGYGQGGAQTHWALLDQGTNPVTGQAYSAMSFDACAPLVGNLELTDIEVIATSPTIPDNEVTLRWSDDAGASWSNGLLRSLGEAGEYFTAPTWYRLGMSRNRILELSWSGARAEVLQGVFVDVTISAT